MSRFQTFLSGVVSFRVQKIDINRLKTGVPVKLVRCFAEKLDHVFKLRDLKIREIFVMEFLANSISLNSENKK